MFKINNFVLYEFSLLTSEKKLLNLKQLHLCSQVYKMILKYSKCHFLVAEMLINILYFDNKLT